MTSVFLPLPELNPTAAVSAVSGRTVSGDGAGSFGRMLETVLAETGTGEQVLPEGVDYSYLMASLMPPSDVPSPLTSSLMPAVEAPAALPLSSGAPLSDLSEPFAPPVNQPPVNQILVNQISAEINAPVPATPQAARVTPDPVALSASATIPEARALSRGPQVTAAPVVVASASVQTPVKHPVQPIAAPQALSEIPSDTSSDAALLATSSVVPQASVMPADTAPLSVQAQTVVSEVTVAPSDAPLVASLPQAPVEGEALAKAQTPPVPASVPPAITVEAPEAPGQSPEAPRSPLTTTHPAAVAVHRPQSDPSVTVPVAPMASSETDGANDNLNHVPVAPASASVAASATPTIPAVLRLPTTSRPDISKAALPAESLTPSSDAEATEGEALAPAPAQTDAQASSERKTLPANSPLVANRSEPVSQNTLAHKPESEGVTTPVAKADAAPVESANAQNQTSPQTSSQTQTLIPTALPAADPLAARAPLQPALMTAPAAPAPAQASNLSSHTVENIAALSAQITRKLAGKTTQFDMQLKPADQGRVDVRLEIAADGKLSAHLSFDSPISESEFRGRQDELRRQLEQAGFQLEDGALSFSSRERQRRDTGRDSEHHAMAEVAAENEVSAPLAAAPRPYAGAPVDGLYSSGHTLSLSMLV